MNWASGDFMPKRGREKASQTGQLNQSTGRGVSREREWLRKEKFGENMGEAWEFTSPITFCFLSSFCIYSFIVFHKYFLKVVLHVVSGT